MIEKWNKYLSSIRYKNDPFKKSPIQNKTPAENADKYFANLK